jgi:hypothetical protein
VPAEGGELVANVGLQHLGAVGADHVAHLVLAQRIKDLLEFGPILYHLRHEI